ncbi:MAG: DUF805 domain-containing protein [Halothiobacillaceae bacterium]
MRYLTKPLFEDFLNFLGRSTRTQYWYYLILSTIFFLVVGWIFTGIGSDALGFVYIGLLAWILVAQISISVRRIHDIGLSGWWGLIFIPLGLPMIIVGLIPSAANNKYGNQPLSKNKEQS